MQLVEINKIIQYCMKVKANVTYCSLSLVGSDAVVLRAKATEGVWVMSG